MAITLAVSHRHVHSAALHGLKLIDALLGVALADLTQGFVLVSSCLDVLGMQHVVLRFLRIIASFCQL